MKILKRIKTALKISLAMFLICGLLYPLLMTGLAKLIFPSKASGSLLEKDGKVVGSEMVGQDFTNSKLFHPRPSAVFCNTKNDKEKIEPASGSENLAVSNPRLKARVKKDIDKLLKENPGLRKDEIPDDLLTSSGSGLDPHISVKACQIQVNRIAKNTGISKKELNKLIDKHTERKLFGIFGQEKVNVLKLNLDLVAKEEK
ncbi:MAG: potassium-transporting ATPase subunit KdpC [Peptoniphilus sp.]|nr:potassium-transporting ATPase subunit KdpC [Peptoniphilus sp.]